MNYNFLLHNSLNKMENSNVKKYILYGSVPLALLALYWKPGVLIRLRQRFQARFIDNGYSKEGHSHSSHNHDNKANIEGLNKLKAILFLGLCDEKESNVPDLKGRNLGIRILEIGVGPGANFQYFPKQCQLIAVDPNPYFEEAVKNNLQKHPGVNLERRLVCRAEDMTDIKDNSVDNVVATLVFCNVNEVARVFKEIIRVLVPGGKFYYIDHLPSEWGLRRLFEEFMTKSGLSRAIFNGILTRDIGKDIPKAGFADIKQKYEQFNNKRFVLGVATK